MICSRPHTIILRGNGYVRCTNSRPIWILCFQTIWVANDGAIAFQSRIKTFEKFHELTWNVLENVEISKSRRKPINFHPFCGMLARKSKSNWTSGCPADVALSKLMCTDTRKSTILRRYMLNTPNSSNIHWWFSKSIIWIVKRRIRLSENVSIHNNMTYALVLLAAAVPKSSKERVKALPQQYWRIVIPTRQLCTTMKKMTTIRSKKAIQLRIQFIAFMITLMKLKGRTWSLLCACYHLDYFCRRTIWNTK